MQIFDSNAILSNVTLFDVNMLLYTVLTYNIIKKNN